MFVNAVVVCIWQLPLNFPQQAAALSIVHLFVLAMGGYLLGRGRDFPPPLAVMVGLVAALNGWIICWGAIDWFGALGAFAWFPWAWWGLERALDPRRGPYRFLWPAPFVYLLITGGFPYTVVMLALLVAWLAIKSVVQTRTLFSIWPLAVGMLLGLGLSAPAWLALLDYVSGSARQAQDSSSHLQWIVPPAALPGFILPAWTVKWADFSTRMMPHAAAEMACGLVPPAALFFALLVRGGAFVRRLKWELGLLAIVLLISMLPSANVFRWSFRWLPFAHVLLALIAAEALRATADRPLSKWWNPGVGALGLVVITGAAMWLAGAAGPFGWGFFVAMLAVAFCWAAVETLFPRDVPWRRWTPAAVTFVSLLATYLCIPPNCGVPKYNLDPKLTEAAPLNPDRLYLSIYPPAEVAYSTSNKPDPLGTITRPGSTSMWGGVHLINGYSPIRPAGVAREFDVAIHGEVAPWAAEFFLGWQGGPDAELARIGVDGIIVASELDITPKPEGEWTLVHSSDEGRVYHRRSEHFARIRSAHHVNLRDSALFGAARVDVVEDSRSRAVAEIGVPAGGPAAHIVFSRPYFRGYRARLGEQELEVRSYKNMIPVVEVPAGREGRLVLEYRPWWLLYGGGCAILCAIFVVVAGVKGRASFLEQQFH